jgi:hypothetical protein
MNNQHYKLKWESNSRVKHFVDLGILEPECVIPKTTTVSFPMGCATVRMQQMQYDLPFITIHFKGSDKKATPANSWAYLPTMRISFGGDSSTWTAHNTCTVSGDLDLDAWPIDAVDAVVDAVKLAFGLEGDETETPQLICIKNKTKGGLYKAMTAGHTDGYGYDD